MKSFKCPNDGCANYTAFSEKRRWLYDLRRGRWVAVGPRCQRGACSAEMVPCKDARGEKRFGAQEEKELPFIGNAMAKLLVQTNQDGYRVWLEEEEER